jgi:hypothetical protein
MKTFKSAISAALFSLMMTGLVQASDHGYVTTEPEDHPDKNIFRVNIESVNGKDSENINERVPVGENIITVSLVFNSSWGIAEQETQDRIYTKDMTLQVEKGKTYFLGSKVDTQASAEAQANGSFWEPVVVETKGH